MPPALAALSRVNGLFERVLGILAGACLAGFTVVVFIDVVYRQVLAQPQMWAGEWAVMMFIWSVLAGASVAARRRAHFVVEVLPQHLPRGLDQGLKLAAALATLCFALVLLTFGWEMAELGLRRFSPMMGYSMIYVFAAFPLAGIAFTLFTLEQLLQLLSGHEPRDEGDGGP